MTTFVNNDVQSGNIIYASDHNEQGARVAAVLNGGIDSSNLADAAVTTAKIADGAVTNAKLATGAGQPGGAWQSWTPTLTNLSGGTITHARYTQIGKTVHFYFVYTLAGAGVSGVPGISAPVAANASYALATGATVPIGQASFIDQGTNSYIGLVRFNNSTTDISALLSSGASSALVGISSTVPFTFGNTDKIIMSGTYEAA